MIIFTLFEPFDPGIKIQSVDFKSVALHKKNPTVTAAVRRRREREKTRDVSTPRPGPGAVQGPPGGPAMALLRTQCGGLL